MFKPEVNKKGLPSCPHCGIKVKEDITSDLGWLPTVLPCNVRREAKWQDDKNSWHEPFVCPWETLEQQKAREIVQDWEKIAGLLGTDSGDTEYEW